MQDDYLFHAEFDLCTRATAKARGQQAIDMI